MITPQVGNYVKPTDRHPLVCGCGWYDCAVIASVSPFILISEEGDMMWSCVKENDVEITDIPAHPEVLKNVTKRMKRENII